MSDELSCFSSLTEARRNHISIVTSGRPHGVTKEELPGLSP
ncbi:hypothetical protein [Methyloglobulus sp.]